MDAHFSSSSLGGGTGDEIAVYDCRLEESRISAKMQDVATEFSLC